MTDAATVSPTFPGLSVPEPDRVFLLAAQAKACPSPTKIDLVIGAYRGADGQPWILPAVAKAEAIVAQQVASGKVNYEYLPIAGLASFAKHAVRIVLGAESAAFADGRGVGMQCLSGTGSLRVAFEFLARVKPGNKIYISNPTWSNHIQIAQTAGLTVQRYRYYDKATNGIDEAGLLADIEAAEPGSILLLQPCAHNPTGVDPSKELWRKIADVCQRKQLFPCFDIAYQGLASGDMDKDAYAVRLFEQLGHGFFVCQSMSKNFGLYSERTGCLTIVTSSPAESDRVLEHCKVIARAIWSNPPHRGARLVSTILSSPELEAEWRENVRTMAARIKSMRKALVRALAEVGSTLDWTHVTHQRGMFCFTGLSPDLCQKLRDEHDVFLLDSGRINICAITEHNVLALAKSLHRVTSDSAYQSESDEEQLVVETTTVMPVLLAART